MTIPFLSSHSTYWQITLFKQEILQNQIRDRSKILQAELRTSSHSGLFISYWMPLNRDLEHDENLCIGY